MCIRDSKFSELWGNVAGFVVTFGFLALYLSPQLLSDGSDPTAAVETSSTIMSWTPFAAAAGAAADLTDIGNGGVNTGIAKGVICLVSILAVTVVLRVAVKHDLNNPLPPQHATRAAKGDSLLLPRVPASPVGALYSREIRYWRRDNRFVMSLTFVVVFCAFYMLMGITNSDSGWMLSVSYTHLTLPTKRIV